MTNLVSSYKILPKQNLIIQYHTGTLNLNSYINFAKKLYTDKLYDSDLNHLIHIKNIIINASLDDLEKYVSFSENNFEIPEKRSIAVITKTPSQVTLSTLFKMLQINNPQDVATFSTIEKGIDWLELNSNFSEIKADLEQLIKDS